MEIVPETVSDSSDKVIKSKKRSSQKVNFILPLDPIKVDNRNHSNKLELYDEEKDSSFFADMTPITKG
jgi:hypothetical protein